MKKKLLSLGLAMALSVAVLTGCTQAGTNGANGNKEASVNEETNTSGETQAQEEYVDGKYLVKTDVSEYNDLVLATLEVQDGKIKNYEYR